MFGNMEILNLQQQKGEKAIWCQNQGITLQSFHRRFAGYRNQKKSNTYE